MMSQVTSAATDPFDLLRDFLRGAKYGTPLELMDAALRDEEPGAALLVEFCAHMRVNRRTRRSMATLIKAHGQTPWPSWYGVFARRVYTMMQLCRKTALLEEKAVGSMISASRGMRRQLSDCRFCRRPVTAFGATGTCQNKRHLEINGREARGGAV